jgi:hypothetical protein
MGRGAEIRSSSPSRSPAAPRTDPPSIEARLLRRLLAGLGDPPLEFELRWSGEQVMGGGSDVDRRAATLPGLDRRSCDAARFAAGPPGPIR